MKFSRHPLLYIIYLTLVSLSSTTTECVGSDSFSRFGIIRANIARYIGDQRWLVCYEPRERDEAENGLVVKTEVVGFDVAGNFFRIRGDLRPGAKNMLSLESYEEVSVAFSTIEGCLYIWNNVEGENPFESVLDMNEYEKLMDKFELYPLLGASKDAPIKFDVIKESPDFYNRAIALPRPESTRHLEEPTTKYVRVGIFFVGKPSNTGSLVQFVSDESAALAADVRKNDVIGKLIIDGTEVEMEQGFPLPSGKFIRHLSLKLLRQSDKGKIEILNKSIFLPSALEYSLRKSAISPPKK